LRNLLLFFVQINKFLVCLRVAWPPSNFWVKHDVGSAGVRVYGTLKRAIFSLSLSPIASFTSLKYLFGVWCSIYLCTFCLPSRQSKFPSVNCFSRGIRHDVVMMPRPAGCKNRPCRVQKNIYSSYSFRIFENYYSSLDFVFVWNIHCL
jgi:hypothetical protein